MGSDDTAPVLLIGGTGTVGTHVAAALSGRRRLLGLARSEASARRLEECGVEPVRGDLARPRTLDAAMVGVRQVYLATGREDQFELEWNAIEAAERAGVERIVKVSILYARESPVVYLRRAHRVVDARLERSPVASTVLEPATFMTHLEAQAELIAQGRICFPAPTARIAHVDPRDVAEVAAAVLAGDVALDGAHRVTGPESLTFAQVAERLGARVGHEVVAEAYRPERFRAWILDADLPEWLADGLVEIYADFERRGEMAVADTVERVLGRPPRSLDDYIAERLVPSVAGAVCG
ncbi:MAG: NAD(P)H-binding protein [Actinobacteria bacterium]|nr:NAD(P)H-binding protein [Actinomycetota bacterium]